LIEIPAVPVGTKFLRWRPPNNLFGGIKKRLVDVNMEENGISPRHLPCHEGSPLNLCKVEKNIDLLPNLLYIKDSNITSGAQIKIFEKGKIFSDTMYVIGSKRSRPDKLFKVNQLPYFSTHFSHL
jgi:hypothetical protein